MSRSKRVCSFFFTFLLFITVTFSLANANTKVSGNIVDVVTGRVFPGTIEISKGKISSVTEDNKKYTQYIIPGLVDAHVHIESSMLVPSEFARLAVAHGTVATVSDPHEIANVLGINGVTYMIQNGKTVPFKFYFGAPPCVPATSFETAGATIDAKGIEQLLKDKDIKYMSEMMNFPGVIYNEPEVMKKIALAKKYNKPIDGHAPGLTGTDLVKYVNAGISTDHETYDMDNAVEKIKLGMMIIIREGSAAKNFDALSPLIEKYPGSVMLCSDDKHLNDLVDGHMDQLVKKALGLGYDKMNVLRAVTLNPVRHYGLNVGLLQKNDPADVVIIDDLKDFNVLGTYINGKLVASNGKSLIKHVNAKVVNNFHTNAKKAKDFSVKKDGKLMNVIVASDGQLITKKIKVEPKGIGGFVVSDPEKDILKFTVVNRYRDAKPAVAFIKGFGLKEGAIATSVAHDSHNIVAVGVTDEDIAKAVNLVIKNKGGLAVVTKDTERSLPLPIAGLMSSDDGYKMAQNYLEIDRSAKGLGSKLTAPYMTLSFMALLVIPELKLSDKGLFDGTTFKFTKLFVEE